MSTVDTNKRTALDDLRSHLTPTQFTYLLFVISSDSTSSGSGCGTDTAFTSHTDTSEGTSRSTTGSEIVGEGARSKDDRKCSSASDSDWMVDDRMPPLRLGIVSGKVKNKPDLTKQIQLLETNYSKISFPLVKFRGEIVGGSRSSTSEPSCSQLPVCRRIMGKYNIGKHSRSSSTESIYAESPPDLDNPLVGIAGQIANEPVNPYPVLRLPPRKPRDRYPTQSSFTDISQTEKDIDREIRKLEDFRDISQFFSKRVTTHKNLHPRKKANLKCNFIRKVTNPLYKEYDPTGYHKSEDELALECIQMICNDFNVWTQSLITKKEIKKGSEELAHQQNPNPIEIGPDFLVQILRKDLEQPEHPNQS